MALTRIVANIAAAEPERARSFYADVLGLGVVMDQGWILPFAAQGSAPPQVSVAREGGSGTPAPDISVEVDDFEDVLSRASAAGQAIEYGPAREHGASGASSSATRSGGWSTS